MNSWRFAWRLSALTLFPRQSTGQGRRGIADPLTLFPRQSTSLPNPMPIAFSGIQPSGDIHIGNYLGALRNWVRLQDDHDCIYCVVDLHALTSARPPAELAAARLATAKTLLAVGVDPERSLLYFQSEVPQHAELAWVLGTLTHLGFLNRMTQFKEKSDKTGANLGLYAYPVLMAADILVLRADRVPVGEDQIQHLELARDLAERFNSRFGGEFPLPEAVVPPVGARIMSLKDPTQKMSKSEADPMSCVLLNDPPELIRRKFARAVTDSDREIRYAPKHKPGVSNLLEILSLFSGRAIAEIEAEHASSSYQALKQAVGEAVVEGLAPIQTAYTGLSDAEVARMLAEGAAEARARAEPLQARVRKLVGLHLP